MITQFKIFESSEPYIKVSDIGNWDYGKRFTIYLDDIDLGECTIFKSPGSQNEYFNYTLMIDKPYQKKGYGEMLIKYMFNWLKENRPDTKKLIIQGATSQGVVNLYKKVFGEKLIDQNPEIELPLKSPAKYKLGKQHKSQC